MKPTNVLKSLALSVSLVALISGCGKPQEQAVKSYTTVDDCRADIATDATSEERTRVEGDCQKAFDTSRIEHERTVTHYTVIDHCSVMYERCVPASDGNGYVPFMTGFMLGYIGGSPMYHPYYYDRWHVVYTGTTNLGYYRGGYVMASPSASWTRGYASVGVNRGMAPPPVASTRGVFGGSGSAFASRGGTAPSISNASPSGRGSSAAITSSSSARGGFGGTASASASSSSG